MSFIKTDLTKLANLNKSKGTGSIRKSKPEYVDFFPPCNNACPAGENIQAWLSLAQEGKIEDAWRKLTEQNPMAAIHGRVCYHPCENSCNRKDLDSSVSIHAVERFLGDEALKNNWQFYPPKTLTGKKIMIVGAGPSGLSAAYHLRKLGHEVTIFEAGPVAGGMMNFGIPAYRMPRNILQAEIKRIENFGVKIVLNYKVQDILKEKENGGFDAVFVAIGAHLAKKVNIPAQEASKILDAVSFLKEADENSDNKPLLGRRVAIYGGGNTAMDAARTAKRLGADEAMIIYRRDREHMPAHEFEADEALSEGVKIHWLSTIKNMETSSITVEKMQVVDGKAVPTGEYETLEADSLILALGQEADTDFLKNIEGITFKEDGTTVEVNPSMMTGYPGIFAGGDMVPSERTVTIATGHGKKAARNIDAWLRNSTYEKPANNPLVTIEKLQIWFKTNAEAKAQQHLEIEKAVETFDEIVAGYTTEEAVYEAQRCLSCGNCFECDSCYGACPEGAISKNGKGEGYTINYDLCTGCGVCAEQCPCHALDMVLEH
ncbi:NAD(P)-binding protein [Cloacibacterium normanense]|uniref:Pyridine nucleotide-disulfide oxidoreductase family protein n=1 Tax=Cloacibacterium normanense TaxID=237258 RepID=A0A1E5UH15_9FLAO|nr:NAD(P)-binding protein [Cloacibacterium normanense]AZI69700.1 FAD-dependent oxidoreductase [Cloacibacterium normanense]OEL12161.1 pyridine nucleotide-disulfide oxidoreductase family protein [Cloacibacterium normanense]SDO53986.1 NADPH-dependent glutamate synthase beta chain [Cloacibacterium normanense]